MRLVTSLTLGRKGKVRSLLSERSQVAASRVQICSQVGVIAPFLAEIYLAP